MVQANEWQPADQGLIAWTYDPMMAATAAVMTAGTLYVNRLILRQAAVAGTLYACVSAAGVTLTAGQCFAGLWRASDGALIGITADQSAAWQGAGSKAMPLVGGPFPLPAGAYYAGAWANGVTPPSFFRTTNTGGLPNVIQLPGFNRVGTADTGLTVGPPNPLGAVGNTSQSPWFALGA